MTETVFHWITLAILWACIVVNWRIIWRDRRRRRAAKNEVDEGAKMLSDHTGLTPLQIQVAMDAAMATFTQRVHEMREHKS